ncbi:MAG: hypothetical protein ABIT01_08015 [Thermoanaerobaculia bacterium]
MINQPCRGYRSTECDTFQPHLHRSCLMCSRETMERQIGIENGAKGVVRSDVTFPFVQRDSVTALVIKSLVRRPARGRLLAKVVMENAA